MIVTCERCATQFQLDDSRIPATGVRVRCSRCRHAFQIELPEPGGPAEPVNEEEESDWEFNADLPGHQAEASSGGTGQVAASDAVEAREGSSATSESLPDEMFGELSSFETGESEARSEPGSVPSAGLEDRESELETAPRAALGDAPIEPGAPSQDESLGLSDDEELSGLELELDLDGDPPDSGRRASDEPGSPEESAENRNLRNEKAEGEAGELDFGVPPPSGDRTFDVDPSALIGDRPRWHTWLAHAGGAGGWVMVAALFLLGLHGGLKPVPVSAPAPIAVGGGLEVVDLSGRWVDHVEEGPIYVVSGRLHNGGGRNVSAPRLAVQLLDDAGQSLGPLAPMLAPRRPADLRERSLEALALDGEIGSPGVPAGEKRAFEAVIGPLPDGARKLRVVSAETPEVAEEAETPTLDVPAAGPLAQSAGRLAASPAAPAP